jgi:ectoine hydroxylase-related dioxygenase (phytanoyl-CoA dioxygenase family)
MPVTQDQRFEFDVRGYLHLREALSETEVAEYRGWVAEAAGTDIQALNGAETGRHAHQLNRPVSRVIDADPRFARFLDHPAVEPLLAEFLGENYRHIDNDLYFTYPGYGGGHWHRGVRAHPTGHVIEGRFVCPMVKVFYCLTDVGPGEGEFVVVPGSHKARFEVDTDRPDLPGQHIFDDVRAGDVIVFNEALLHNGRPNQSEKTRQTIIMNLGRRDAGVWPGYAPREETLAAVSRRQRAILSNAGVTWMEPELVGV